MTQRWFRDGDYWYDVDTGEVQGQPGKYHTPPQPKQQSGLYLQSDIKPYVSPFSRKVVDGRTARRDDLERAGCREVDPSEYKPVYKNERFCRKNGIPFEGN